MRSAIIRVAGTMAAAAIVVAVFLFTTETGQSQGAAQDAGQVRRTADGRPDFSGIWQANTLAYWDLLSHEARPIVAQRGALPGRSCTGRTRRRPGCDWLDPGGSGRRRGRRNPVSAVGRGAAAGELRQLARPGSGDPVLPPGRTAGDVSAPQVSDSPGNHESPDGVRIQERPTGRSIWTKLLPIPGMRSWGTRWDAGRVTRWSSTCRGSRHIPGSTDPAISTATRCG